MNEDETAYISKDFKQHHDLIFINDRLFLLKMKYKDIFKYFKNEYKDVFKYQIQDKA